jgi:hypothetical protein
MVVTPLLAPQSRRDIYAQTVVVVVVDTTQLISSVPSTEVMSDNETV